MKKKESLYLFILIQFACTALISPNQASAIDTSVYDSQFTCDTSGNVNKGNGSSEGGGNLDKEIEKNIKDIYEYAHGKFGLSAEAVAGILGNWKIESAIQPHAVEGDYLMATGRSIETAKIHTNGLMGIGYGQWTAGRHTGLVNWSKDKYNGEWWTTDAQLDYMFHGDGGFVTILKKYALTATDDALKNTVLFHNTWEISNDTEEKVISERGGATKDVLAFMKSQGMTGAKDENKINTIAGDASSGGSSSSNAGGSIEDVCAENGNGTNGGSLGQSTKVNGAKANILKTMSYEDALSEYKDFMTLPKFDVKGFDWSTSPFISDGMGGTNAGQCTELTWAYMSKLYEGTQPTMGNGGFVWESYKNAGATITDKPTTGYGFSALDGYAGASGSAGHTGVVLGVFEDGSFLTANFNFSPHSAPERYITVTLIAGVDGSDNIKFFSGVGAPTISENK